MRVLALSDSINRMSVAEAARSRASKVLTHTAHVQLPVALRQKMAPKAVHLAAAAMIAAACVLGTAEAKFGRLIIAGVVPCNTGSLIDIATSPAFPNAEVELRCAGKVVAGATTNSNGSFAMEADLTSSLAAFLGGCSLVVDTPLVKCNAELPAAGTLVSYLRGPLTRLLGGIFHLFPAGFSFHGR